MPTKRIGRGVLLYPLRIRELPHLGHFTEIILRELDQLDPRSSDACRYSLEAVLSASRFHLRSSPLRQCVLHLLPYPA